VGQTIQRSFPELSILLDPLRGLFQRLGVQLHFVNAAVTPAAKQSGFFENAQMFRNRRQRHRMWTGKMGDALIALGEVRENAAPGGIGQGSERSVQSC
jgi:hypothetical protein